MKNNTSLLNSIVDYLERYAYEQGDETAYTFVNMKSRGFIQDSTSVTFSELRIRALQYGHFFQQHAEKGDNVVLAYRNGLEFLYAFYGCLYAGVQAVPACLARSGNGKERLASIIKDTQATIVMSNDGTDVLDIVKEFALPAHTRFYQDEDVKGADHRLFDDVEVNAEDIAFLQYSSGSNGAPKGVMISHQNLVEQCKMLQTRLGEKDRACMVSWLPHFHDMGLVLGLMQSMFRAGKTVFMSPDAFIRNPLNWLRLMEHCRADFSVVPNFALDLCVKHAAREGLGELDLSCVSRIGVSAEPVRASSINQFYQTFAPHGMRADVLTPSYGLAEATLIVAGKQCGADLKIAAFETQSIKQGKVLPCADDDVDARLLVGNGQVLEGYDVRIVNPETSLECEEGQVGEIWVGKGSVGQGYWANSELSESTFEAHIHGSQATYMRTGDLGFFHQNELYVSGRLKDLIIINGANHHANDIEESVKRCAPDMLEFGAVFSVEQNDAEQLVIIQEVDRKVFKTMGSEDKQKLADKILQQVAEHHELVVQALVLYPKSLPRTTSGKIRRHQAKELFLSGEYDDFNLISVKATSSHAQEPVAVGKDVEAQQGIQSWLIEQLQQLTPAPLSDNTRFLDLHLSTKDRINLLGAIQTSYNCMLTATIFEEQETIADLAELLANNKQRDYRDNIASASELMDDVSAPNARVDEPIAIVGLGCRFPDAENHQQFWRNLCEGKESLKEVPADRWDIETVYNENPLAIGKMNTRRAGFLDKIDMFDRQFFGLSVRESTRMDPAHRMLMEIAWETFENAGIVPEDLEETNTAVYIGISGSDYAQLQFNDEKNADAYAGLGSALTNAASRISHFFNLRGPAMALDTACSSSLTSVHMACSSIRSGEVDMALAGGVNILLSPNVTMSLTKAGMMAPDGRCKTFDAAANGYVRAEGIGLVMLKPLSKAQQDGDNIYAVIRGTASNQDGKSSGISAPNGKAQQAVIMSACKNAGIQPGQLDYVEAHGTGTSLGDPIEINALGEVLKIGAEPNTECGVGSVKTNIGHAESAAGIASLIKTVMMLENDHCPKSLNFDNPNPAIDFDGIRVKVQSQSGKLSRYNRPALVGVNSFGVGGTNVHVILEQWRKQHSEKQVAGITHRPMVLPLNAQSNESLQLNAKAIADYLEQNPDIRVEDAAYTLGNRRALQLYRATVTADDRQNLIETLKELAEDGQSKQVKVDIANLDDNHNKLAFVYSGQGSQWFAMGRSLMAKEPVFRDMIEKCDAQMRLHADWSLLDILADDEEHSRLGQTEYAQPAIFAMQVALTALWKSCGIEPQAVTGHSVGEVSSAFVAGVISFEDACRIIITRAKLMQATSGNGSMVSVEAKPEQLEKFLQNYQDKVSIAALNGPTTTVLSGDVVAIDSIVQELEGAKISCVKLNVNYAFHSYQMESAKVAFMQALADVKVHTPTIPLVSTVTGQWFEQGETMTAKYWGDNIREKVQFMPAIETLIDDGFGVFLEVGARPVLTGGIAKTLNNKGVKGAVCSSLQKNVDEFEAFIDGYCDLHRKGVMHDWRVFNQGGEFLPALPNYQWNHQRFWLDGPHIEQRARNLRHPLVRYRMPGAEAAWEVLLDHHIEPLLTATRVGGETVLPSSVIIEMLNMVRDQIDGQYNLKELTITQPLVLKEGQALPAAQLTAQPMTAGFQQISLYVQTDTQKGMAEGWLKLASAILAPVETHLVPGTRYFDEKFLQGLDTISDPQLIYKQFNEAGMEYDSPAYTIEKIWLNPQGSCIVKPAAIEDSQYCISPKLLESAEQACRALIGSKSNDFALAEIGELKAPSCLAQFAYLEAKSVVQADTKSKTFCVYGFDAAGQCIAIIDNMRFDNQQAEKRSQGIPQDIGDWQYRFTWQAEELHGVRELDVRSGGAWLIFSDELGVSTQLGSWLTYHNQKFNVVTAGDEFSKSADGIYTINPNDSDSYQQLIDELYASKGEACPGIIHSWSLNAKPFASASLDDVKQTQMTGSISLAFLIKALSNREINGRPRLWLLTSNAQQVNKGESVNVHQAPIWGMCKSAAIEHPELKISRVDIPQQFEKNDIDALCKEIFSESPEDQIAFRDGVRHVMRMLPRSADTESMDPDIVLEKDLSLYALKFAHQEQGLVATQTRNYRTPTHGSKVEIAIEQMLLDTMTLTAEKTAGSDMVLWSGRVLGDTEGQQVVSMLPCAAANLVNVEKACLSEWPQGCSFSEYGASLLPYVTAKLLLGSMAGLPKGASVFVNGVDTLIGRACVNVAKTLNCKVVASYTHEPQEQRIPGVKTLGHAQHCTAQELRNLNSDKPFDLFINCLDQADLSQVADTLGLMASFVDLSLAASGQGANLQRLVLKGNQRQLNVDLNALLTDDYQLVKPVIDQVLASIETGGLGALEQQNTQLEDLLQGIELEQRFLAVRLPEQLSALNNPVYHKDGTYIVTGGLGGLGLTIARNMASQGAGNLVLLSRRTPSLAVMDDLERIRQLGANVVTKSVDVSDEQQVVGMLNEVRQELPPIKGILHAAGILSNGLLVQLQEEQFHSVYASKIDGAMYLHQHATDDSIEFFVMFSSLASAIGSPGQSNYAAANGFLDGLAAYRNNLGLPGLSVCWGPWEEVGMAAENSSNLDKLADHGIGTIDIKKGLSLLDELIEQKAKGCIASLPMNWELWSVYFPIIAGLPFVKELVPAVVHERNNISRITKQDISHLDRDSQLQALKESIHKAVCQSMMLEADALNMSVPLTSVGLDSIVALELKTRIEVYVDVVIQTYTLLKGYSVEELAELLLEQILDETEQEEIIEEVDTAPMVAEEMLENLGEMSADEVDKLLQELSDE